MNVVGGTSFENITFPNFKRKSKQTAAWEENIIIMSQITFS